MSEVDVSELYNLQEVYRSVPCNICNAEPGEPCLTTTYRKAQRAHASRQWNAREIVDKWKRANPFHGQLIERLGTAKSTSERIHFRLMHMECCGQLLCWVNPRFPTHCPECGRLIYPQVKGWVTLEDPNAHLRYKRTK